MITDCQDSLYAAYNKLFSIRYIIEIPISQQKILKIYSKYIKVLT
ncbi:hypothetical protein HMPREF9554_01217 [Treponema phagedenis F0421]|nr:hypothetical protein HMPREF9554_01217 [Treponema phagedenis F0421]